MLFGIVYSTLSAQHGHALLALPPMLPFSSSKRRQTTEIANEDDAACYARYSSDGQNDTSIDDQLRECRAAAGRLGMKIPDELMYDDRATSGTLLRRDGLDRLLEDAQAGKFRTVYFFNLSRLARESVISLPILKQLVYVCGVRVISVKEGIDSTNSGWEMIAALFSVHHEQFIRDLSDNVRKGLQGTVLARFSVGDFRFGYNSIPSPNGETIRRGGEVKPRRIYAIFDEQANWVRKIFYWFVVERRSRAWIVKQLNQNKVQKDHRSSTAKWTKQLVVRLLRSPKYIGLWPWGLNKNERNPFTGKVEQKPRDEDESAQWMREFPELRIVSDEIFWQAQQILDRDAEKCSAHRRENGELNGSDGSQRTQLLTGLFICPSCRSPFYVCGSNGDYLGCSGHRDGNCESSTVIPRRIAKQFILQEIGKRILQVPEWIETVYKKCLQVWAAQNAEEPGQKEALQRQIRELDSGRRRLMNSLEHDDKPDPYIRQRLREIRQERESAERQLNALQVREQKNSKPPTRDYIAEQLMQLHKAMQSDTPAANEALRNLLGSPISLELISEEGRKRKYWRGRFQLRVLRLPELTVSLASTCSDNESEWNSPIEIDFRKPLLADAQVEEAWNLLQQGRNFAEIGKTMKLGKSRATGIMKQVAKKYGDGLSPKDLKAKFSHKREPSEPFRQYIEPAMKLYDQGLLEIDIAGRLKTNRKAISAAIAAWHTDRGLPVPDGRTRRKSLAMKERPRNDQPSDVQSPSNDNSIDREAA